MIRMPDKYLKQEVKPIDHILEDLENGLNLSHSLKRNNTTSNIFFRALEKDQSLQDRYNSAVTAQTHALADQLLEIPDTYEDTQRAKLKSDNIKWLISRRNRKAYGDKFEVDVNHSVDIRAALNSAEDRLREVNEDTEGKPQLNQTDKGS